MALLLHPNFLCTEPMVKEYEMLQFETNVTTEVPTTIVDEECSTMVVDAVQADGYLADLISLLIDERPNHPEAA